MESDEITIPHTAIAVNITNLVDPYLVRVYETKDYTVKLEKLSKKLQCIMQKSKFGNCNERSALPQRQNKVIVHNRLDESVDLPSWWCRGIICLNMSDSKYGVFLPDYGNTLQLDEHDFTIAPYDLIKDEYLTSCFGIYNILPAARKRNKNGGNGLTIIATDEWSKAASEFSKQMIFASRETYFDHLASDEHGRKFGELYCIIENEIIPLSKALVDNEFAVYLDDAISLVNLTQDVRPDRIEKQLKTTDEDLNVSNMSIENGPQENYTNGKNGDNAANVKYKTMYKKLSSSDAHKKEGRQKLLICSKINCRRVNTVVDAKFPAGVFKALKSQYITVPRQMQTYIWPAVAKGLHVAAIGSSQCGKTLAYIAPLISTIINYKKVPQGNQPVALILCSSSTGVSVAYSFCKLLLESYSHVRTVAAFNGKSETSLAAELYNGCQILISTPPVLTRFMNKNRKNINFDSLCHLILDGADVIFDKYFNSVAQLFDKHDITRNRDRYSADTPILQLIIASQSWTKPVNKFVSRSMDKPFICIGSYLEAAVFAGVRATICVVNAQEKNEQILGQLGERYKMIKTIIICTSILEAEELNQFLTSHFKQTLLAHDNITFSKLQGIQECWKASVSGKHSLLICTDGVLSDVNITDAQWLIHYSITSTSKSSFYFRFSTLMGNYLEDNIESEVLIMADESNDVQFQGIVDMIQRFDSPLPSSLLNAAKQISVTLDRKKVGYPICDNVKSLGYCTKRSCPFRHCVLHDVDKPMTKIGIGDHVKMGILYQHTATHFSVRLIEYTKFDTNETIKFPSREYVQLCFKIGQYYVDPANRRRKATVNVGDVAILEESPGKFKRVQVLHILEKGDFDVLSIATVRCIDDGVILDRIHVNRLLEIPEELSKWPSHIVELFISGIAPFDNELTWNRYADDMVEKWLERYLNENSYAYGKVLLHLGNTLWIDSLEIHTKLIGYPDMISSSLKLELIDTNNGVINQDHLERLRELCKIGGLTNINGCSIIDI